NIFGPNLLLSMTLCGILMSKDMRWWSPRVSQTTQMVNCSRATVLQEPSVSISLIGLRCFGCLFGRVERVAHGILYLITFLLHALDSFVFPGCYVSMSLMRF